MEKKTAENMPEEVLYTDRTCSGEIQNKWGENITNVWLYHRRNLSPEKYSQTWGRIDIKRDGTAKLPDPIITYCTGCGLHDYWYLQFHDEAGRLWKVNKDNFYCDLKAEDQSNVVTFTIKHDEMDVDMASGRCYQGID